MSPVPTSIDAEITFSAIAIFGVILAVFWVIVTLGVVFLIIVSIASAVLFIFTIICLLNKNYGPAAICFTIGLIMLPFAFTAHKEINEWKKTDDFKKIIVKTIPLNNIADNSVNSQSRIYVTANKSILADSKEMAALGKGKTLDSNEKKVLLEKNIKSLINKKIEEGKSNWESDEMPYNYRLDPYTSPYSTDTICEEYISCRLEPDCRTLVVIVKRNWKKYELHTRIINATELYSCLEKGLGGWPRDQQMKVDIRDQNNRRLASIEWSWDPKYGSGGGVNKMDCAIVTMDGKRYFSSNAQFGLGPELVEDYYPPPLTLDLDTGHFSGGR